MCNKCEKTDNKKVIDFKIAYSKNHPRKAK